MTAEPAPAAPSVAPAERRQTLLVWAEPLSIAALFIFMLWKTWLRWPGPLIDFPRDLYFAWRVSLGDLLYDQLANWYGPLAQLVEAAGFRLFGVGLDTIVWMNIALTAGILLLLRGIFGFFGSRLVVWLCSVVFICIFAFGNFIIAANYNFITPYSAQATYGFAGLLLVIWALLHHARAERLLWLGVAGFGLAVAYLDKHEPLFAAAGALGVYFLARIIQQARSLSITSTPLAEIAPRTALDWPGAKRWAWRAVRPLVGGFFSLWLPVFLFFLREGGVGYALRATNRVPLTMLDNSFIDPVANSRLMRFYFGFDHPWANFLDQLGAGVALVLICVLVTIASRGWARAAKFSVDWWMGPVVTLTAGAAGAWLARREANDWMEIGQAVVFPVFVASAYLVWKSLRAAWRNQGPDFSRTLGLAVLGTAASLMLTRMVLNVRVYHFGFFMAPLAVLFVIQIVVGELARAQPDTRRANILLPLAFTVLVLIGVMELERYSFQLYDGKTYVVGTGRDRFYSYPLTDSPDGPLLNWMMDTLKKSAPTAKTLAVLPEGIAVNYHLRIPSTLAETEFQPLSLSYVGPQHVLDELQAHPPDVIFLCLRDMSEFDVHYYGENEASGRNLLFWVSRNYQDVAYGNPSPISVTRHVVDMFVRKPVLPPAQ